jgi:hypothetical protein
VAPSGADEAGIVPVSGVCGLEQGESAVWVSVAPEGEQATRPMSIKIANRAILEKEPVDVSM